MTVQQLNRHPLNQAARQRLSREGERPGPGRRLMYLLDLAHLGLLDHEGEPPDPLSPQSKVLADWSASPLLQRSALAELDGLLEPQAVLSEPLPDLSKQVVECLQQAGTGKPGLP